MEILFLNTLYWTLNSPDVYPKSCKSCTGSISIMGYKDSVVDKLETFVTSAPVTVVLFMFKLDVTPGFKL